MGRGRRKLAASALLVLTLASACSGAPGSSAAPAPDVPLPHSPRRLADRLTEVSRELRRSAEVWRRQGISRGEPPSEVALGALYEQRAYRSMARRPQLAAATIARLPGWLAGSASDETTALRDLFRLAPPPRRRRFRTGDALPAGVLLRYFRQAERRFHVGWRVLAAVNLVESDWNRLRNDSVAGAKGPMQFLPGTWRRYGLGGNVHDPHDAILGAANYLHASGAPRSYRRALRVYNPSSLYVDGVLRLARRMAGRGFLVLYNWQVFVRTPAGERRLTGPGR